MHDLGKRGKDLASESNETFNRTIYHQHQELEFPVPFGGTFERCKGFKERSERLYLRLGLPYTLIEVRFAPDDHERTLIGAGGYRRSAWIDLIATIRVATKNTTQKSRS
jgi:hypothetical protein